MGPVIKHRVMNNNNNNKSNKSTSNVPSIGHKSGVKSSKLACSGVKSSSLVNHGVGVKLSYDSSSSSSASKDDDAHAERSC